MKRVAAGFSDPRAGRLGHCDGNHCQVVVRAYSRRENSLLKDMPTEVACEKGLCSPHVFLEPAITPNIAEEGVR